MIAVAEGNSGVARAVHPNKNGLPSVLRSVRILVNSFREILQVAKRDQSDTEIL